MAIKKGKIEKTEIKEKLKEAMQKPILSSELTNADLIEVSGVESLDNLDPMNLARFEKICIKSGEKIERMLDNVTRIKVHVKAMHKGGKQRKYEMDIKVLSSSKTFAGSAVDWEIEKVTHECFKDIEKQIIHHFKNNVSYRKTYS